MAPTILHLPNGQNLTVTPVFGGLYFKSHEVKEHHAPFPAGWTVVINTEEEGQEDEEAAQSQSTKPTPSLLHNERGYAFEKPQTKRRTTHRFIRPTMDRDHLFISSISQPSSNEFRPVNSPTRQIAMMLWATLWWYFHQPEPDRSITTKYSEKTHAAGRPRGPWKIYINREGVLKSKIIMPKLERMGLIASEDSTVGADLDERAGEGWLKMFVSRSAFWQMDARIYLFTMTPAGASSPFLPATPAHSRPGSPTRDGFENGGHSGHGTGYNSPGPFHSTSHLPTYYPPAPPQYVRTNGTTHPIRPKPPKQGETFYTRFVPSVGQYLSFRVASQSPKPQVHKGPVSSAPITATLRSSIADAMLPSMANLEIAGNCDPDLLHKWMNEPRVAAFWGEDGPLSHQEEFLKNAMRSRHSFPVIGCWDGKPFGYFEIYWVKEDNLGKHIPAEVGNYDRGIHCLVGEQEFRGPHRVKIWLSALVHYCWMADNRTETVMMEPRVDNEKYARRSFDGTFESVD